MTISDIELKVSVESALHDAIKDAVQKLSDEYGIQIEGINISWTKEFGVPPEIYDTRITSRKYE